MTLLGLLDGGRRRLKEAGIIEWDLDAWYLLEYTCGCTRNDYFLHSDRRITERQEKQYNELIQKRSFHIPLQHLTGSQEFMGLSFFVNGDVLIPRQDTEILVETALMYIRDGMRILDMCTGSGCILLSVLHFRPGAEGVGADISLPALKVAEKNAGALGVEAKFCKSDLFSEVTGRYDCILSNPPYIPSGVVDTLAEEVRVHEPRMALDGHEDGLYYYREILRCADGYLKAGGLLFFEVGHDQAKAVKGMMEKSFADVCVVKDLSGLDRVVYGRIIS